MNRHIRKSGFLFVLLSLFAGNFSNAQFAVVPVSSETLNPEKEGIFYALPLNKICATILVQKTETYRGPFADYASKYLGLTNVNRENLVKYVIADVKISLLAEPDPDHLYFIGFDKKSKGNEISLAFTETGIISGFSDVNLKDNLTVSQNKDFDNLQMKLFKDLLQPTITEKVDTIIRRVSVDTTTIEERIVRRSLSEKSAEQMANEAAEMIRKIDENIFNLMTGYQEVNYSKESLEFMISELRKTQNEYLSLFKGTSRVSSEKHEFFVTPVNNESGLLESLCKFSPNGGIMPKTTPSGENINLSVTPLNSNKALKEFASLKEQPGKKSRGLYYRIPQQSLIRITLGVKVLLEKNEMISQLGVVTHLPLGSYSNLIFNPVTGAISHISIK